MIAITIPKFFSNIWFWFVIIAIVVTINFFKKKRSQTPQEAGKPAPSKADTFFAKHKKTVTKLTDIFIICYVLFLLLVFIRYPVSQIFNALSEPQQIRAILLQTAGATFFIVMIPTASLSGVLIGCLSVFQSNLTRIKRFILLIICLLPTAFAILFLLIEPLEDSWSIIIKLGLAGSLPCWIINGPAVLTGRHFFQIMYAIARLLRLAPENHINGSNS